MDKLNILWTSGEKETFMNMVAMYSKNAKKAKWFDEINIVIWGASTRLAAEDSEVLKELQNLLEIGITIEACKACANKIKAAPILREAGITVKYMTALTGYIKGPDHLITV